ncbi:hypothetical protein MRB53_038141 [Persea americana]|nr:hypothetical protein MRB53_038141 [Persea americana]
MDELFDVFNEKASKNADDKRGTGSKKRSANGRYQEPTTKQWRYLHDGAQSSSPIPSPRTNPHRRNSMRKKDSELQTSPSRWTTKLWYSLTKYGIRSLFPPDCEYVPISQHKRPEKPAREWPFRLDPFQEVSIASIERNESVLVSAHTSAGKTVVAEYAIAQCLKNNQRVIYTSPIKALSNQKYREFNAEFGDVGLMTGDVTINPTATCLVMTTEILRSMLYRGETIILLPDKVRYVFLSATIPNAMQFAEWITKTHNQPCHVVYTDFRPTPLQHYFFPAGADGIHLIVDEKGAFREDNFNKAMAAIADKAGDDGSDPLAKRKGKGKDKKTNKGGRKDGPTDIYKIVKMIMVKNYNPVIVFSSRSNDESEKNMVSKVFSSAIEMLSDEDKELPQIQHILPLLRRGIGIHHSGLLPILKETIEILSKKA